MLFSHLISLLPFALEAQSSPFDKRQAPVADSNKQEIESFFSNRNAALGSVKTTTTTNGQVLDWVPAASQGKIADLPPALKEVSKDSRQPETSAIKEILDSLKETGPPGTVPFLRPNLGGVDFKTTSLTDLLKKTPGLYEPGTNKTNVKRADTPHRYASSSQYVTNYGGQGRFSVNNPAIEARDFSLLQVAVIRDRGAYYPGGPTLSRYDQTIEAGWVVQKVRFNDYKTHLFTYYTTNGYSREGNNLGGWNRDVGGWVQVDSQIYPGIILSPTSVVNGEQRVLWLSFQLYNGNWWLWVIDRWIGYYPASLFRNGRPTPANTLSDHADRINFYGEIADDLTDPSVTTSDMGSGQFPATHYGRSAYIHNIAYQANTNANSQTNYNGGVSVSIPSYWDFEAHFVPPTSSWGSYAWLGGPGRP